MNNIININLDGCAFQIEEEAYNKLNTYLDTIKSRLGNNEEAKEIVADIEARIAELFQFKCPQGNITLPVVSEIIETIGEPAEIVDEEDAEEPKQESKSQSFSAPPPYFGRKGLYRDRDDRVFAGVCSGLGAYFDVDPLVFRIIAVVTTLLSVGAVPIIYIVLWIAMPEARTLDQRMRMRGAITFKNVGDNIKEEYNAVSNRFKSYSNSQNYKNMQNRMNKTGDVMANGLHAVLKIIGTILGIGIVLWSVLCIMIIAGVLILKDAMPFLADSVGNLYITNVPNYFLSQVDQTLATIGIMLVLGIPFLVILYLGLMLIFRFKSNGKAIGLAALGLWIAGLLLLFFTALHIVKGFEDAGSVSEHHKLESTTSNTVYLKVANKDNYSGNKEYLFDLNDMELSLQNGKLIVEGDPQINISRGDDFSIHITKNARGLNEEEAEFNATSTEYFWAQNDSIIYLDRTFSLSDEALIRQQNVNVNIQIPHNKSLQVSPYLDRLIDDY